MKKLGQKTKFGKVVGIMNGKIFTGGERYYFLKDKRGTIALMPASVVEQRPS